MAGSKTDFLEDELIDHVLRNTAYGQPATVYLSLHTADPTDSGLLAAEISGDAYVRQSIAFDAPSPAGETQNTSLITFPVATPGNWGTITHFGICDAESAGNMLYHGDLDAQKIVNADDQIKFAVGAIQIDET